METTMFERHPRALWRRVGNEVLLAPPETDGFSLLSDTAGRVWILLDRPSTAEALARRLGELYGASQDEIEPSIVSLLDELSALGVVVEAPEGAPA